MNAAESRASTPETKQPVTAVAAISGGKRNGHGTVWLAASTTGLRRSEREEGAWVDAYATVAPDSRIPTFSVISCEVAGQSLALAGVAGGVLQSVDYGASWQPCCPFPPPAPTVTALLALSDPEQTVLAATAEDGVFTAKTPDGEWEGLNLGLVDMHVLCLAASAPSPLTQQFVYAGVESGLYVSTNKGRSWRSVQLPGDYDAVLAAATIASTRGTHLVLIGTEHHGLLISDDGQTWNRTGPHPFSQPVNQVIVVPYAEGQRVVVASGPQLWVSSDLGRCFYPVRVPDSRGVTITALGPAERSSRIILGLADGRTVGAKIA